MTIEDALKAAVEQNVHLKVNIDIHAPGKKIDPAFDLAEPTLMWSIILPGGKVFSSSGAKPAVAKARQHIIAREIVRATKHVLQQRERVNDEQPTLFDMSR